MKSFPQFFGLFFLFISFQISFISCDSLTWDPFNWKVMDATEQQTYLAESDFLTTNVNGNEGKLEIRLEVDSQSTLVPINILWMQLEMYEMWSKYGELSDDCLLPYSQKKNEIFGVGNGICGGGWSYYHCNNSMKYNDNDCNNAVQKSNNILFDIEWNSPDISKYVVVIYTPTRQKIWIKWSMKFNPNQRKTWLYGSIAGLVFSFLMITVSILAAAYIWVTHKRRLRIHQLSAAPRNRKNRASTIPNEHQMLLNEREDDFEPLDDRTPLIKNRSRFY